MPKFVTVLHLSDLHFGMEPSEKIPPTAIDQRILTLGKMAKTLKNLDGAWRPRVVAISGDIAWKGKPEDYEKAKTWLSNLLPALDLSPEKLVVCPGNHDIDRAKTMGMPPPPDHGTADEWLKLEHIENFSRPFGAFVSFCDDMGFPPPKIGVQTNFLTGVGEADGLRFVILNSAWFCRGDKDRNNPGWDSPFWTKWRPAGNFSTRTATTKPRLPLPSRCFTIPRNG